MLENILKSWIFHHIHDIQLYLCFSAKISQNPLASMRKWHGTTKFKVLFCFVGNVNLFTWLLEDLNVSHDTSLVSFSHWTIFVRFQNETKHKSKHKKNASTNILSPFCRYLCKWLFSLFFTHLKHPWNWKFRRIFCHRDNTKKIFTREMKQTFRQLKQLFCCSYVDDLDQNSRERGGREFIKFMTQNLC